MSRKLRIAMAVHTRLKNELITHTARPAQRSLDRVSHTHTQSLPTRPARRLLTHTQSLPTRPARRLLTHTHSPFLQDLHGGCSHTHTHTHDLHGGCSHTHTVPSYKTCTEVAHTHSPLLQDLHGGCSHTHSPFLQGCQTGYHWTGYHTHTHTHNYHSPFLQHLHNTQSSSLRIIIMSLPYSLEMQITSYVHSEHNQSLELLENHQ